MIISTWLWTICHSTLVNKLHDNGYSSHFIFEIYNFCFKDKESFICWQQYRLLPYCQVQLVAWRVRTKSFIVLNITYRVSNHVFHLLPMHHCCASYFLSSHSENCLMGYDAEYIVTFSTNKNKKQSYYPLLWFATISTNTSPKTKRIFELPDDHQAVSFHSFMWEQTTQQPRNMTWSYFTIQI